MEESTRNQSPAEPYEAPRIESVLEAEDVEREVHYAGGMTL